MNERVANKEHPPYRAIFDAIRLATYLKIGRRVGGVTLAMVDIVHKDPNYPDDFKVVFEPMEGFRLSTPFLVDELYERSNTIEGIARIASIIFVKEHADNLQSLVGRG